MFHDTAWYGGRLAGRGTKFDRSLNRGLTLKVHYLQHYQHLVFLDEGVAVQIN